MKQTLITEGQVLEAEPVRESEDGLWLDLPQLARLTGWTMKPEGACKDDVCVPLPYGQESLFASKDAFNYARFMRYLGHPVVSRAGTWVVGARSRDRNEAMRSMIAPDFTLPDIDGNLHSLSDYRGKKVFLASWASW